MTPQEDSAFQEYKNSRVHLINTQPVAENPYHEIQLQLEQILQSDQNIRNKIIACQKKNGRMSDEFHQLTSEMREIDSLNCFHVTSIIDEFGWLGADEIGPEANSALFLVIQHSDLEVQEKYFPIMKQAVDDGNAEPSSLALLEDRIRVGNGEKQIYGTQLQLDTLLQKYVLYPIEDELNVNKRRAAVGLNPLEEYVKQWGIIYKIPKK